MRRRFTLYNSIINDPSIVELIEFNQIDPNLIIHNELSDSQYKVNSSYGYDLTKLLESGGLHCGEFGENHTGVESVNSVKLNNEFTIGLCLKMNKLVTYSFLCSCRGAISVTGAPGSGLLLVLDNEGTLLFDSCGTNNRISISSQISINTLIDIYITHDNSNNVKIYVDGKLVSDSQNVAVSNESYKLRFGFTDLYDNPGTDFILYNFCYLDKVKSNNEILEFHNYNIKKYK